MKGEMKRIFALLAAAAILSACVTNQLAKPNPVADEAAERDGKTMEAKPGLGRIYVVHGNFYEMPSPPLSAQGATTPEAMIMFLAIRWIGEAA